MTHSHEGFIGYKQFHLLIDILRDIKCKENTLRKMMFVAQSKKGEIFGNFSNMWAVGDHTGIVFLIFLDEKVKNTGLYLLI